MANNVGSDAYATYYGFNTLPYKCVSYLMDNNELIWKLLKYNTPTAWSESNLSATQKAAMIYAGQDNTANFRVFLDDGAPDVLTEEMSILRISTYSIYPENRTIGTISMMLEVYCHFKANHLSNYTTRIDTIMGELLSTFNGKNIGVGIGKFFFDRVSGFGVRPQERMEKGGQVPYRGRWAIMSTKSN